MKFSKMLLPKYTDNRHARAIKVSLNKLFGNTSALNIELAKIISSFSHSTHLVGGSFMISADLRFFIVQKLLSNHWCLGWFCPSKVSWDNHEIRYVPNFIQRGTITRKRINAPFSKYPSVNVRKKNYYLEQVWPKPYNHVGIRLFSQVVGELF